MGQLAEQVSTDIKKALKADELDLPTLPEVALRIRDEAQSNNVSATSLAKVIAEDPGLAAQLVRTANSPMFMAARAIDDLAQAISRLGVEYAANIVVGLAMQQMFQATSELIDSKMREVWKTSTDVAAWSGVLAKRFTDLRPDQATLAGLTHSIGALPILSWAEEHDEFLTDSKTLDRLIESIHPTIGTMILMRWNFAEEIIRVPEGYMSPVRQSSEVDYVDLVSAALLLVNRAGPDVPLCDEPWAKAPVFARIGIDLSMDALPLQKLTEQVEAVRGVFN
ncbi:MAG: HDOD domain-containing protein [Pseudomonadaceae bacterium]|nr:HDOD domain-containing protein [Pseudomonadaceae bacterium]